ncbi:MAG: M4 family metallopeptidase [Myxococcota bacterium]
MSRDEAARAHDAGHAWLVSLDAHDGAILGLADTTRSCEDGVAGTVVTSSEGLRAGIDGVPAATHPIETCESSFSDTWYLEDHRQHADIHVYDASGFSGPATAGAWFDACVQPACFAVSGDDNTWTADEFQASDYRNIERAEGYYRDVHGRDGADDSGEDIEVASGIDYDNATGMGIFRTVAFGRPVPERGLPSYGVLDVAAHELTHVVSWHEWVGLFDYGFEGTLHGVEGAVDEHMGDMIGAFVQWRSADEEWLRGLRWAFNTERMYGYNYQFHAALDAYAAIYGARNYYLGQDGYTPRAHIDQLYVGPDDGGGVHTNAVILGRAVYLYAEGGRVDADPDDRPLFGWPADAPRHRVSGIGMAKAERITYHTLVTSELVTPFGEIGLGDLEQVEQDATGMRRELERFAAIDFASCLAVAAADGWRVETCAAVRNAYAGVGLMELDGDSDGLADSLDNCRRAANADQADQDGDGVGDACDVCPTVADGDQADQDQDGVGDACACFPCAGADACALASCQHGQCVLTARVCDDRRDCTLDRCDAALGCLADPSACPCSTDADCDDHNACDGVERCGDGGTCLAGTPPGCNDGAAASIDSCAPAVGCRHIAKPGQAKLVVACLDAATECDDHNACTRDGCDPLGGCRHDLVDCDDGDTCTTDDHCDTNGECKGGDARDCDDDDPCTTDACDPKTGCTHVDNTAPCDDGIACTANDKCDHGTCRSGPDACDDNNPCTTDVCDGLAGCKHFDAVGACSDNNPCTVGDHCEAGVCHAGDAPNCDDGKLCTVDDCTANGLSATCSNAYDQSCLDTKVAGGYYGLATFALDENASQAGNFDCLGSAALTLVTGGATDVLTGSASCDWELSPNPSNHVVLMQLSALDTGEKGTLHLETTNILVRHFAGTLVATGALKTTLTWDAYVTTDFGNPQVISQAVGTTLVLPNQSAQRDVAFVLDADLSDAEVPLCCLGDGTCFPGGQDLCDSVGGQATAPAASGECCLDSGNGVHCVDTPAAWCEATPGAIYSGAKPSACCLASGCAQLADEDCAAAGGTYAEGLDCSDGDDDGFADACPAPAGCGQPGLATCSLVGGTLRITPTGFMTIPLPGLGWTPAGTNKWTTLQDFSFDVAGKTVTIGVPALVTVDCNDGVSVNGALRIPALSAAGFDVAAPTASAPSFTLSFKLGQDLASLNAPLSDCRTYLAFEGDSNFTIGSGSDQSVLNNGSHVVLAIDPNDPGFYGSAEGNILDGPSKGLLKRVGFGVSRGGFLKWVSEFAVPPAPGRPPEGTTIFGHVYASGDFTIPLPGGVMGVEVDGDAVFDLGPFPEAGEAVLAGILAGDIGAIDDALTDLGSDVTSGQVLDEMAYGVNAHAISLDVRDVGTFKVGQGTLVAEHNSIRFSADVGSLDAVLPDQTGGKLQPLFDALDKFTVKSVYHATGVVDPSGFELTLKVDLAFGPVALNGTGLTISYRDGGFSVSVSDPSLSFDFMGWLESLKDFVHCDFSKSEVGCNVAGFEVGKIAFSSDHGHTRLSMESVVPGAVGKVTFSADVTRNGAFVLTGTAAIQMGAFQTAEATLVLSDEGVRVIAVIPQVSQTLTFDGTMYYDGSFVLAGLGTMGLVGFITMDASASLSYCPSASTCASKGNPVGDLVLLVNGKVNTPVGDATLEGELTLDGGELKYDLTGDADFSLGGFASLDGTMRVTNIGRFGAYLHVALDLPLVTGNVDGELFSDGDFTLAGDGSLDIPGFSNLAQAHIAVSKSKGVRVSSSLGVSGAQLAFEGRVGPDGFVFTGYNDFSLLGFHLGGNVTFSGNNAGGDLAFAGGIDVGGNGVDVTGHVASSGQYSFTGKSSLSLFGYQLTQANVTFDNTGLSLAGKMNVLGIATFDMSGRIDSSANFSLHAGATAATFPGGLDGQLSAGIEKVGTRVTVHGSGYANFFGAHADGSFVVSSSGQFSFTGHVGFGWSGGNLSLEGDVTVQVGNSGFSASAYAEACADFLFDSGCAGVGGSVDSDGDVCVKFPIVGRKCVGIL